MKKFRLCSVGLLSKSGDGKAAMCVAYANSLADLIQDIESNAGWYADTDCAFKVAYIEEVVE
ncbi:hypothetical protein LLWA12L8_FAMOGCFE_00995 [Lactococcus lactis]